MLARAEQKIFSILDTRGAGDLNEIHDILQDAMARIDARMRKQAAIGGVETGFTEFDSMTGGLHESELVILAARPSMGKTALALNIAEFVTMKVGVTTLFVSLEMSSVELADRMLCSIAQVNGQRLRNGTISNEDRRRLMEKAADLSQAPLFVDDTPSRTMTEIAAAARRLKRQEEPRPDRDRLPAAHRARQCPRSAAGAGGQDRPPAQRAGPRDQGARALPGPTQPAGGSQQGQPAPAQPSARERSHRAGRRRGDVHPPGRVLPDERRRPRRVAGQADIIIGKQRNGPTGEARLLWNKDFTRFVNHTQRPYDELEQFNSAEF